MIPDSPGGPQLDQYNPEAQGQPTDQLTIPATVQETQDPGARQGRQKQLNPVVVSGDALQLWWDRISKSEARMAAREDSWNTLLKAYLPIVTTNNGPEDVKVNAHFRNIHTKLGQLFVRSPEVRLSPKGPTLDRVQTIDPTTGAPLVITAQQAVATRQAVVNQRMSEDEIDGVRLMDECLLDIMMWAGLAFVKFGYKCVNKIYNKPRMQPDPNYVPPTPPDGILGLAPTPQAPMIPQVGPDGQPLTDPVPVPIFDDYFADRFSPKKGLLDELLKSCRHEKMSRWIGMKFYLSKLEVMRNYGLAEDDFKGAQEDDKVYKYDEDATSTSGTTADLVGCYEIWFKGTYFLVDELHPEAIYQMILVEGVKDRTVVCRKSPDQTFDEMGQLTDDSLRGFPIKVGVIRDLPDSPYPPADSAFTAAQAKNLDTHRQQSVQLRDAQIGKYAYDTDALDAEDLGKIRNGKIGDFIGLKGGTLANGVDKVLVPLQTVHSTQEDGKLAQQLENDMNKTLGISAVQQGSVNDTVRSATEVADVQTAAAGRQEKEQSRMVSFYISIVRGIDVLTYRYAKGNNYVQIVGQDGTQKLMMWNKTLMAAGGRCSYDIKPNSQLHNDASMDFRLDLQLYNAAAKDPLFNRVPVLRGMSRARGYDPFEVVMDPTLAIQSVQPPHGGPNDGADVVSKHTQEASGQRPNQPGATTRNERNPQQETQSAGPPQPAGAPAGGVH